MNKLGTGTRSAITLTSYGGFTNNISNDSYSISSSSWTGSATLGYQASVTVNSNNYRWGISGVTISSYILEDFRAGTTYACSVSYITLSKQFRITLNSGVSKPTSTCTLTISYSFLDSISKQSTSNRNYYYCLMGDVAFNSVTPLIPTAECEASLNSELVDPESIQERFWVEVTNPYPYPVPITYFYLYISDYNGQHSWGTSDLSMSVIPPNSTCIVFDNSDIYDNSDSEMELHLGGGNSGYKESDWY